MKQERRTAIEAGWHVSRYNLYMPMKEEGKIAIVNLYKANCAIYSALEYFLLTRLEQLDENHPVIERFAKRGIIAKFDELEAMKAVNTQGFAEGISLTICPTMDCNFDCPYCFERHLKGFMSEEIQDGIINLSEKMLEMTRGKMIDVTWFGGEPLLAPEIIRSLSRRLIELAERIGAEYNASIITNGYLLTESNIDMLREAQVRSIQVTLDGVEEEHDKTRHLRNGGGTFQVIAENMAKLDDSFTVNVRHNVHQENMSEIDRLSAFVQDLDRRCKANLTYRAAVVSNNEASRQRGSNVGLLCTEDEGKVSAKTDAERFIGGGGKFCGAQNFFSIGIDANGNLQRCWEDMGNASHSFGNVASWNPRDPFATATNANNLTMYLNSTQPGDDEECRECIWLPKCKGECPHKRIFEQKKCVPYKEHPEIYIKALLERMKSMKA